MMVKYGNNKQRNVRDRQRVIEMKINDMPVQERPREKLFKYGKESLSITELVAILIGTGSRNKSAVELAAMIAAGKGRGLGFLAECTPEELMSMEGVGRAKACELLAAVELGRRMAVMSPDKRDRIATAEDVARLFMEKMRHYKKEHFVSHLINSKGEVIEEVTVSIGDLNSSTTHPREVFVEAVRRSAGSVIFVHNHPSGDPAPSEADLDTTSRLVQVGMLLGIPVLDHIIIGDGRYVSLKAEGHM
ncbi:MAG: DNA repair protein RadC [Clostridiales bacterium]|nr:DNA repair protein RadC [Clostridiales bacterium]